MPCNEDILLGKKKSKRQCIHVKFTLLVIVSGYISLNLGTLVS